MSNNLEGKKLLYSGKAKDIYEIDHERVLVVYTDKATAFNGKKSGIIAEKGSLNCRISAYLFTYLEQKGIRTHFVSLLDNNSQLVRRVEIIPLEVVVRNRATGSLLKRVPLEEGTMLKPPVVELYYKSDELNDPLVNEMHAVAAGIAEPDDIRQVKEIALKVNNELSSLLKKLGMELIDMKLEFGRDSDGMLLLADEISPDTMRVWDRETGRKLDKDRFRQDLGEVREGYEEILHRIKEGL